MSRFLLKPVAASVLLAASLPALATNPGEHFWGDSQGRVVRDGQGNCVRTMYWSSDTTNAECGGKMKAAVPAATPAPVAVAPMPAPVVAPPVPTPPAVTPPPAPIVKAAPTPITLRGDTSFRTGSSELSGEARAAVADISSKIKGMTNVTSVTVSGHTDSSGAEAVNQRLSEARANAVRSALIEDGVDGSLITAHGHGEANPVADNATAAGRSTNRRVEIEIDGY